MISVFEFTDYRKYLSQRFREMPKKGHGQLRKWAEFIGVHTTLVSQILNDLKSLTPDQAILTAEFLGLNEIETEYFMALIQYDRAGNEASRKFAKKQLERTKEQAQDLKSRLTSQTKLSEEQRAVFYSDWAYTAVRQATAIPGFQDLTPIATALDLPTKKVRKVIDFLLASGLCKETRSGLIIGPSSTHLEVTSPWVRVHHTNWREKAIGALDAEDVKNLFYTSPLTISKQDSERVRERVIQFIEDVNKIVDPSPSEQLHCLNIDWFKLL